MPFYIVRAELHGAGPKDHETLDATMIQAGFARTITLEGKQFELPTAQYCVKTPHDIDRVLTTVKDAATRTGRSASILVTESSQTAWSGLYRA